MKIIFCLSNLFVPHTLTLIKNSDNKVLIYTDQEGIYKLFTELSLHNVETFFREDLNIERNIRSAKHVIKKRKEILKWLLKKRPVQVYFFHNTFGSIENWLIKELSKKTQLFHIPVFNELPFKRIYNFESLLGILKGYFFFRIITEPLWDGQIFRYKLSERFFIRYHIERLKPSIDEKYIRTLFHEKFNFTSKKIVLLSGSVVESGQVEESEYIKKINNLIKEIGIENIIVKPHPRFPYRYGLEKKLDEIPYYIPINLLYSFFDTYIGYSSTALSEAADLKLNAISTLDYLETTNEDRAKSAKQYLISNTKFNQIYFFTDLNSLKNNEYFNKYR
jgi:hypothetical protein